MQKLKIEKLVEGGQGIAYEGIDPRSGRGQVFFVWNVLPEEEVEAEIINKRKGIYECLAVNILKPSPHRIKPTEDYFLSCSPWQIMDFEYENKIKHEIAIETYKRIGKLNTKKYSKILENIEIFSDNKSFGYRNKMEFSFVEKDGKISLALFQREQKKKVAIDSCKLAAPTINQTTKKILEWINENKLTERNLKSLIIRSNKKGEVIAGLFIKDKLDLNCRGLIHQTQKKSADNLVGFSLYYSTHKSPASVTTEILYQEGQDFLIEEIECKGSTLRDPKVEPLRLKYGINSFFQVNVPVFEMTLKDISDAVGAENFLPINIVDFYSGVGTIGLFVAKSVESNGRSPVSATVESNEEAVAFAHENIEINNIVETHCNVSLLAEKTLDYIQKDSILIFDPPRAGLHQKVVDRILEVKPLKIIYLSCNVATQARDIGLLKNIYDIELIKLYNFFPRTPHIESLIVLSLKE